MKGSRKPYPDLIVKQARLLAKHLRGTGRYRPYKTKW